MLLKWPLLLMCLLFEPTSSIRQKILSSRRAKIVPSKEAMLWRIVTMEPLLIALEYPQEDTDLSKVSDKRRRSKTDKIGSRRHHLRHVRDIRQLNDVIAGNSSIHTNDQPIRNEDCDKRPIRGKRCARSYDNVRQEFAKLADILKNAQKLRIHSVAEDNEGREKKSYTEVDASSTLLELLQDLELYRDQAIKTLKSAQELLEKLRNLNEMGLKSSSIDPTEFYPLAMIPQLVKVGKPIEYSFNPNIGDYGGSKSPETQSEEYFYDLPESTSDAFRQKVKELDKTEPNFFNRNTEGNLDKTLEESEPRKQNKEAEEKKGKEYLQSVVDKRKQVSEDHRPDKIITKDNNKKNLSSDKKEHNDKTPEVETTKFEEKVSEQPPNRKEKQEGNAGGRSKHAEFRKIYDTLETPGRTLENKRIQQINEAENIEKSTKYWKTLSRPEEDLSEVMEKPDRQVISPKVNHQNHEGHNAQGDPIQSKEKETQKNQKENTEETIKSEEQKKTVDKQVKTILKKTEQNLTDVKDKIGLSPRKMNPLQETGPSLKETTLNPLRETYFSFRKTTSSNLTAIFEDSKVTTPGPNIESEESATDHETIREFNNVVTVPDKKENIKQKLKNPKTVNQKVKDEKVVKKAPKTSKKEMNTLAVSTLGTGNHPATAKNTNTFNQASEEKERQLNVIGEQLRSNSTSKTEGNGKIENNEYPESGEIVAHNRNKIGTDNKTATLHTNEYLSDRWKKREREEQQKMRLPGEEDAKNRLKAIREGNEATAARGVELLSRLRELVRKTSKVALPRQRESADDTNKLLTDLTVRRNPEERNKQGTTNSMAVNLTRKRTQDTEGRKISLPTTPIWLRGWHNSSKNPPQETNKPILQPTTWDSLQQKKLFPEIKSDGQENEENFYKIEVDPSEGIRDMSWPLPPYSEQGPRGIYPYHYQLSPPAECKLLPAVSQEPILKSEIENKGSTCFCDEKTIKNENKYKILRNFLNWAKDVNIEGTIL